MKLTIIAHIEAKQEHINYVKEELLKLIQPTKKEQGYLEYRPQQDNQNPAKFIFFERWENIELWQEHMESEHLQTLVKNTEGKLVNLEIQQMCEIG